MALEGEKKETNVLMVAFSAQGHINPMLRLGKRLVSKGLQVTLATNEVAQSNSFTRTVAGVHLEFFSDGLSLDYKREANMDYYMDSIGKFGPINLSALIQSHSKKFSCIINNPFVPWVSNVAAKHEIPCAMLWIQPCTLYAIYYRFYNSLNSFPTSENPQMNVELPGLPSLCTEDLPSFILPSSSVSSFPKMLCELFQDMKKLKWVLGNSFQELETDVTESMDEIHPIWPVGPLVPSSLLGKEDATDEGIDLFKSEDTCIEWLNRQKPSSVIYISFGSLLMESPKEKESIATALKRSGHPFLWVVKPSDSKSEESEGTLPLKNGMGDQGLIVKWSPQTQVLAHPSVACFLSHCGWNSLSESITAGVPIIAYPQWTDQPTNAKLITDVLHIGVRLTKNQEGLLGSEEVEKCIQEIMSGPRSDEYKTNAAKLKQAAREAVSDGGSSDRNIQLFVDEIIGNC
ncbi:hypothetical protein RJ639_022326 [Escallonia herrerae]|uniref:Glycosyltransferase n=1 Tax=Escallonia herrerae TaxID=1293975 RepID=A0AA89AGH6_9ASTE|nr:hypothetical protein RJ639_022326 [Escallonia herrerae]